LPAELPIEERAPVVEELREPTQAELAAEEVPSIDTVGKELEFPNANIVYPSELEILGKKVYPFPFKANSDFVRFLGEKSPKENIFTYNRLNTAIKEFLPEDLYADYVDILKQFVEQSPNISKGDAMSVAFTYVRDINFKRQAAGSVEAHLGRVTNDDIISPISGEVLVSKDKIINASDLEKVSDVGIERLDTRPRLELVGKPIEKTVRIQGQEVPTSKAAQAFSEYRDSLVRKSDKAIEPKDAAIADKSYATFKTEAEARGHAEAEGLKGEVIQDPLTGEWMVEPDFPVLEDLSYEKLDAADYALEREQRALTEEVDSSLDMGEPTDGMFRDLVDIFNNERGAITVDQKDLVAMRRHVERVKQLLKNAQNVKLGSEPARETINRYLDQLGVSDEAKAKFQTLAERLAEDVKSLREADPITENILNPEGKVIHQRDVKTKKGSAKGPPITEEQIRTIRNARKLFFGKGKLGRAGELFEIRQEAFERFGKPIKEMFFDRWQEKLTDSQRELKTTQKEIIRPLKKQLTKQEVRDLSVAWASEQKGGVEALAADGIKVIPKLNEKQLQAKEILNREFESLLDRINYVRVRTGRDPIPKLDNYFPFIHQQNALKKAGIHENILTIPVDKIASSSKKFRGTFFPFEKPRKVTDIPIELDVVNAYDTYLKTALKEIHVSPIAALAKEFANERILNPDNPKARPQSLNDYNPDMARVLNKWADEIMGNDPVGSILGIEMPAFKKFMDKRAANLVASVIFGNVGTVLKQPTALRGVYAETTHLDLVNGIARTAFEKPFRLGKTRAQKLSNVLQIRSGDILFSEMAEAIATGNISGAKRVIGQIAAAPMNIVDAITAEAAWNAGYSYGKRKLKLSDKEAVRHADDVVGRTQGIGIKGAVSPIQANAIGKWFTLLNTFAIADFNFLAKQILGIKNPYITKPAQVKRALKYVIGGALINEAFRATGQEAPFPSPFTTYSDAMDEGDSSRLAMAKAFKESLEVLPLIGGAVKYESSVGGPIGQLALDVPKAVSQTFNMVDHERMSKKEFRNSLLFIGDTLGQYYGIPMTRQLKKSIRAIAQDGNWPQILLGLYVKDEKKGLKGIGGLGGLKGLE
jgi:hypothetical protein